MQARNPTGDAARVHTFYHNKSNDAQPRPIPATGVRALRLVFPVEKDTRPADGPRCSVMEISWIRSATPLKP